MGGGGGGRSTGKSGTLTIQSGEKIPGDFVRKKTW